MRKKVANLLFSMCFCALAHANSVEDARLSFSTQGSSGQVASALCAVPGDCVQPRIKAMRIEGDNVFLTVENLKGFMRVGSGADVSASDSASAAVETVGRSARLCRTMCPQMFFRGLK